MGRRNRTKSRTKGCISIFLPLLILFAIIGKMTQDEEKKETNQTTTQSSVVESSSETVEDSVPTEYKNALKSAENYINFMPFSKQGLYNQLTSDAGDKYPAEAAQYAIDNINVDYKEQALRAAKNYQDTIPMSIESLKDQLMSEYGDKYTEEEASYAIANLE